MQSPNFKPDIEIDLFDMKKLGDEAHKVNQRLECQSF